MTPFPSVLSEHDATWELDIFPALFKIRPVLLLLPKMVRPGRLPRADRASLGACRTRHDTDSFEGTAAATNPWVGKDHFL